VVLDLAWVTVVAYGVDHGVERELTKVPALHHRQSPSRSGATKDFLSFD